MNQIIFPEKTQKNLIEYENNIKKNRRIYKYLFIFSSVSLILFISYFCFLYFKISQKENLSKNILSFYNIQQLYSSNTPSKLPSIILENGEIVDILGIINIDKINLTYPILSKTTDDSLEIAPCKFYGNILNGYGNFCIAGHNYDNNELFSNLYLLEIGDIITIYELNR